MATFTKVNTFTLNLMNKVHDLNDDTLKLALTNSAPSATDTDLSDITEITAENGYSSGGNTLTASTSQTTGTATLAITDLVITASGGSFGPFRYAVVYNDTAASNEIIGYVDYGASITVLDTETFTADFAAGSIVI